MFYASNIIYWLMLPLYPIIFSNVDCESYEFLFNSVLFLSVALCSLSYTFHQNIRKTNLLTLMMLHRIYTIFFESIPITYSSFILATEIACTVVWASWLLFRYERQSDKNIDKNNILLAFYKGKKGSIIMRFFALFGFPVKSVCILAGDKALYLQSKKSRFVFGSSEKFHRKEDDYIIIDTGKPYTEDYINTMQDHADEPARSWFLLRVRCISAIKPLLCLIGPKFEPSTNIPSLYLRGI